MPVRDWPDLGCASCTPCFQRLANITSKKVAESTPAQDKLSLQALPHCLVLLLLHLMPVMEDCEAGAKPSRLACQLVCMP